MSAGLAQTLTIIAVVGNGVVAGVFFAFSTFVMKGLARLPTPIGIVAMQGINLAAPTPPFMVALFGSAMIGAAVGVVAIVEWGDSGATYALLGGVASLVPVVLTIAYHVPRNEALARVDPHDPAAADRWTTYVGQWTAWNHVRTVGALAAVVLFTLSLCA